MSRLRRQRGGHPLDGLPARGKTPASAAVLQSWVNRAAAETGIAPARLNTLIGNSVVLAALQQSRLPDGLSRFLLKGGTQLEARLGMTSRASKDLDTLFRGAFEEFVAELDGVLALPVEPFDLERREVEEIAVPGRRVQPQRVRLRLKIRGRTVFTVALEVAPDEAGAGAEPELLVLPSLAHFGVRGAGEVAALALEFQVAQKLHACTDPPRGERLNQRVHDVVDLLLVKRAFFPDGSDLSELCAACEAVFVAREQEAVATGGMPPRPWPPTVVAYDHWPAPYAALAAPARVDASLDAAVAELNSWVAAIGQA